MKIQAWICDSLHRQFPSAQPGRPTTLDLVAARGERVSFQVGVRTENTEIKDVAVSSDSRPARSTTRSVVGRWPVQIRRVGYVPLIHHNVPVPKEDLDGLGLIPGYVPDPLFPETRALLYPREALVFWVTVDVPRNSRPGRHDLALTVKVTGRSERTVHTFDLTARLTVAEVTLRPRRNFPVTHWFYADALCDWYKTTPFSVPFWALCERYFLNYAGHGSDTVYVPVFTPSLDGVKRPTQLLDVRTPAPGKYEFDWTNVRRWIRLAQACGIRRFEWAHLFTQWGCAYAIRVYRDMADEASLFWPPDTGATSDTYRNFLAQYLPALHRFLVEEKLLADSFFHISDEPHGDVPLKNYRVARAMLRELAPWMKVMDAMSDIAYGREKLMDIPIPNIRTTLDFIREGIPSWTYFCCDPRDNYLNRLLDTPLAKIRMSGWLFYKFGCRGFLHWGYNYWYHRQTRHLIDPFSVSDGLGSPGWAHGDPFVVYPGPDGPLDSIRWEVFAESLQDFALLQTLGVDRDDPLLRPLKDFRTFPRNPAWVLNARRQLLGRK